MAIDFNPERLIAEIESRPTLWDTGCDDYSNRDLRKKYWDEIVDIFIGAEEITLAEREELGLALKKKWDNIRACFTRELNRQIALRTGGNVGIRKSEYIYFKQLDFLKNVVNLRKDTGDPLEPEYSGYGQKKKRVKESESEDDSNISTAYTTSHNMHEHIQDISEQDEDHLFLMSLLTTLKKVPEDQKMATKIKIMTILDEATQINYT